MRSRIVVCALAIVLARDAAAQAIEAGHFPWKKGDDSPAIAGISLRTSRHTVDSLLGPPKSTRVVETGADADTTRELEYPKLGLRLTVDEKSGVIAIQLLTKKAGALDSIRVDDEYHRVLSRWGRPDWIESGAFFYRAGDWVIIVGWASGGKSVAWIQIAPTAGTPGPSGS
jgi:hypothetical protein